MSNLYADRDIIEQGDHYSKHVSAMTSEGLHSKSDIAAELAHRDIQLEQAEARVAELSNLCERLQRCAQGFYVDQGDYGHMEAIMKDYHWIMRASKPWRDAYIRRVQAEAVERAAMNFGGRDYSEVRLGLCEWAKHLRQQADEAEQAGGEK